MHRKYPNVYIRRRDRRLPLDNIEIIGQKDRAKVLPGSGYVVDEDQLKIEAIDDINQALKTVPGLYIEKKMERFKA